MLGALATTPAFAAGIAIVTDVVNEGYRQPPGDDERRASPSDELVSDEALRTESESSIAVKFVDGSELRVEARSEVVLSDYLFDPEVAAATGVINLNTGLFHFSSNDMPDDGIVLKTPVATIGIRGTEFLVTVKDETTIVDILDGKVQVTPLDGGAAVTCEGGQSILVAGAKSDAVCGDLGSFSTAAGGPAPAQPPSQGNSSGRDGEAQSATAKSGSKSAGGPSGGSGGGSTGGGGPGGGDPGGGDPGGGDPGGGDPGGGDPGGPAGNGNHSGLGDGSNPGNGHGNGHGGGNNNGGTNNPGGGNH